MSAYLVSTEHIDLLVDFARSGDARDLIRLPLPPRAYDLGLPTATGYWEDHLTGHFDPREFPDQLGRGLLRANWDSLAARYQGRVTEHFANGDQVATYAAPRRPRIFGVYPAKRGAELACVLKQLDCFDYQACEVTDYRATWARAVTDALRRAAICRLPDYQAAPWGL